MQFLNKQWKAAGGTEFNMKSEPVVGLLETAQKKTAWKIGMRMSRTFTKLLTKAQWIHFPSSRPIKYDNDRKRSRDVTGKKISSLGNRSACRRTPIGLDGFVLLVYFQLKRRKQQRTRSALVQHSSMCWGVFTVPVAERQYVLKKHPSLVSSGAAYICGLIEWGWIRKTDFIKTSRRAPAPEAKKLRGKSHSALRDWNMETQKRKQMQAHTHTHTPDPSPVPPQACLQKYIAIHTDTQRGWGWLYGCAQWPASSQAQSFFCLASFRTTLSSSLRDFCSSSRNCFIHLFSCKNTCGH